MNGWGLMGYAKYISTELGLTNEEIRNTAADILRPTHFDASFLSGGSKSRPRLELTTNKPIFPISRSPIPKNAGKV